MKNKALSCLFTAVSLLLLCAVNSWAKGDANISATIHNLSTSGPDDAENHPIGNPYLSDESEVCIFCHTPHGGVLDGPLWNRSMATGPWTHYNSATLSSAIKTLGVNREVSDESMLCMACHDGSISVMHLINPSGDQPKSSINLSTEVPIILLFDGSLGSKIGGSTTDPGAFGDLSDDHPISFSYSLVLSEYSSGAKAGQLRDVVDAENWQGEGVRFFGSGKRVECSSCHDPHVDYVADPDYKPFLIRPNSGSNLCLACHNK